MNLNDPGDVDTGTNEMLDYPEIAAVSDTHVSGTACPGCIVEFFASPDPAGSHGPGERYLSTITADGSGSFSWPIPNGEQGGVVTATATSSNGSTSEFSPNVDLPVGNAGIADDEFDRSVSTGWGEAELGGRWKVSRFDTYSVDGQDGVVTVPSRRMTRARLDVNAISTSSTVNVSFDALPSSGAHVFRLIGRAPDDANEYRARVRLVSNGGIKLAITRVSGGSEIVLGGGQLTVPGTYEPGSEIIVRLEADGDSSTTLRAKAWLASSPEPAWMIEAVDDTPSLQAAGSVGLRLWSADSTTARVNSFAVARI